MRDIKSQSESAVSPVIGVILMVAITVILAAIVGVFVLGIGDDVSEPAQAALQYDGGNDVLVVSAGNVDELRVPDGSGGVEDELTDVSAGDTLDVSDVGEGESFTVVGVVDGEETVISTYERP